MNSLSSATLLLCDLNFFGGGGEGVVSFSHD